MKRTNTVIAATVAIGAAFSLHACWAQVAGKPASRVTANADWPVYGGQPANQHYSSLAQINRGNVNKGSVAKFE